jgi:hypothetical protein
VADYFELLLEEFSSKDGVTSSSRDQPSPGINSGHGSSKLKTESSPSISDTEEPSFNFKWWYMVRLVQWHLAEGLLLPSILIDRILNQLQVNMKLFCFSLNFVCFFFFLMITKVLIPYLYNDACRKKIHLRS